MYISVNSIAKLKKKNVTIVGEKGKLSIKLGRKTTLR